MDNLKVVIESAINRELTEKELLYVEWLARMDYETIEVFTKLFEAAAKSY
jgi:hypothetical protein